MQKKVAEEKLIKNKILFTPEVSNKKISHIAIYFKAGSVDDGEHLGITHLIEHMLFKGTEKRNYLEIISAIESNGCDINAYTTKEAMVVHASFLNEFYKETIEILGDIISNPSFPEKELKKEKTVIIDEIRMYRDNPGEKIYDDFEAMLFKGTPLAHEITGTISSVKKINRENILYQYFKVIKPGFFIVVNSDLPKENIISLIDHHFDPSNDQREKKLDFSPLEIKNKVQFDESSQTHIIIGCRSYPVNNPLRPTASLLANYLGGAAMSSYLNLILREQMGLTYSVETSMNNFSNTGIFYTYYTCDPQKEKTSLKILKKIFQELYTQGMSHDDLQKAKKQLKGQIAIHFESGLSWTLFNAKYFHYYSKTITFEELMTSIENINEPDMNNVIKDHLNFDQLFSITIKKKKNE